MLAVPNEAILEMGSNYYIEVFAERFIGLKNTFTVSMNPVLITKIN
jgi:hypothetical protein